MLGFHDSRHLSILVSQLSAAFSFVSVVSDVVGGAGAVFLVGGGARGGLVGRGPLLSEPRFPLSRGVHITLDVQASRSSLSGGREQLPLRISLRFLGELWGINTEDR